VSRYRLYLDSKKTDFTTDGKSPAKALKELVAAAGLTLVSADGRYGKLDDGRSASAMTETWSRRRLDPNERTTRLLRGR
jgi:hypothetical protein